MVWPARRRGPGRFPSLAKTTRIAMADAIRVAVTGAAGQVAYPLVGRLASGEVFGPKQKVILQLLEIPPAMGTLEGVAMELGDCSVPTLQDIVLADDPNKAFRDRTWLETVFVPQCQNRGAAVIKARGSSSAFSAANGALDHLKSLLAPTPANDWVSAAVISKGEYGVPAGLVFSYPCRSDGKGNVTVAPGLKLD